MARQTGKKSLKKGWKNSMVSLFLLIILPILISTLIYLFRWSWIKILALFMQLFVLAASINNFLYVKYNGTVMELIGSNEKYVGIALRADLLSCVMVMLTAFLFLMMLIFNFSKKYVDGLFLFLFLTLQALVTGVFLSNDLFNIYVLVEVSTVIVSILIMFKRDGRSIYDGMVYLFVNIVAMTMFLFGVGYIYKIFGVLDMTGVYEKMSLIEDPKAVIAPYVLLITAVGLKSALMPLFSWLPKAHGTPSSPSIVSALLSGLYVKGGIYLFIRVQEMFKPAIDASEYFLIMGFLTGVIGFILAILQSDIKLILSYSTISQIGIIMVGINYMHEYSYWGAVYHIINHAVFKSTLFLTAGIIVEEYGTRHLPDIRGVFKRMPIVAIASVISILGITGAPFFNGSISKYLIQSGARDSFFEYSLFIINLGTLLCFIKYSSMFFGKDERTLAELSSEKYKDVSTVRKIVVLFMAMLCFIGGIFGQKFISFLFNFNVSIGFIPYMEKVMIYFATLILGVFIYKWVIVKNKLFTRAREFELSFNDICLSIVIFFGITTVYLLVKHM